MSSFRFTQNFSSNLREIQDFLQNIDGESGFVHLLDELDNTVMPNLARFPEMGGCSCIDKANQSKPPSSSRH